ncbi:hypothetical protein F4861DRAFT_522611 [Xylaria intraflava]|nr:hypothetical protein F4861DRAFT_522611 [Xylaria intraflava]
MLPSRSCTKPKSPQWGACLVLGRFAMAASQQDIIDWFMIVGNKSPLTLLDGSLAYTPARSGYESDPGSGRVANDSCHVLTISRSSRRPMKYAKLVTTDRYHLASIDPF